MGVVLSGIITLLLLGCAGAAPEGEPERARSSGPSLPWGGGSNLKIGYVRSDVIVEKYPGYKDADNKLKQENGEWLAEADLLESEIRRKEDELEELRLILSDDRRAKLEKELTEQRKALQKYRQDTWYDERSHYITRRNELMEPINARINDAIWKVAENRGLDMVFDTISGNIVYVKPELDITEEVLEELQR